MKKLLFIVSMGLVTLTTSAQNEGPAVGQWKSYLCYYSGTSLDYSDEYVYVGTNTGFFTYHMADEMVESFSKVNGMSDIGIAQVHYNPKTEKAIIAYQNGNIDVYDHQGFKNVPDFMISTLPGDKVIYNITSKESSAYMSTSMGLVVLDLEKNEIEGTTQFYDRSTKGVVLSNTIINDSIFVATEVGVFKTKIGQPFFQDYSSWIKISDHVYQNIVSTDSRLYTLKNTTTIDSVFQISTTGISEFVYRNDVNIGSLNKGHSDGIIVTTDYHAPNMGEILYINKDKVVSKVSECIHAKAVIQPLSNLMYFVDEDESTGWGGLREVVNTTTTKGLNPHGPASRYVADVIAKYGELWVAHGGYNSYNWRFLGRTSHFSSFYGHTWDNHAQSVRSQGGSHLTDASRIIKDYNTNTLYVGYANGGLVEYSKDNIMTLYREDHLDGAFGDTSQYIISGLAIDKQGQVWMTNYAGNQELKVKTKDGQVHGFHSLVNPNRYAVDLVIDDYGSKWYYSTFDGGLIVYNDNGTLDNPVDDRTNVFKAGKDFGNLPSNNVQCLAKDRSGTIWVGTNNGIGIFNAPKDALEGSGNDTAELRIVKYEGDFDYKKLFTGQSVTSIAVDGDNRKWVGTSNNGVFLISADAQKMIHHFTSENSPLLSNEIIRIGIDDITGDVYFGTPHGLIAYRGSSTAPAIDISEDLIVYPNPVPSGYDGYISIKELKTRCEVTITDVNGYIITKFDTNGGQAVWDGKDYNGRRPQTGVYLIFITDRTTGKTIKSGKFMFQH